MSLSVVWSGSRGCDRPNHQENEALCVSLPQTPLTPTLLPPKNLFSTEPFPPSPIPLWLPWRPKVIVVNEAWSVLPHNETVWHAGTVCVCVSKVCLQDWSEAWSVPSHNETVCHAGIVCICECLCVKGHFTRMSAVMSQTQISGRVCVCFSHCKWGSVSMRLCGMLAQCVCVFLHIASGALCQWDCVLCWHSVCVCFCTLQVGLCVNETVWHAGRVCVCVCF